MSLASSPDCLLRPEDKALKYLFPTVEHSVNNSFDEFFNKEFFETSGDEGANQDSSDFNDVFVADLASGHGSIHAGPSQFRGSPPSPWRKGVWCMTQKSGSGLAVEKTRKTNNVPLPDISPAHLVANDNFALRSPRSITQPYNTKNLSPNRLQDSPCWSPAGQQRTPREMTLSPSPMYSRSFVKERDGYVDTWQQDFQNFNLQPEEDYLHSFATPDERPVDSLSYGYGHSGRAISSSAKMENIRAATIHHLNRASHEKYGTNYASAEELSSIIDANINAVNRNMFSTLERNDSSFKFINEELPGMSDWTSDSNSSHNSHQSQLSNLTVENHQNGMYNTFPPQDWWSPPAVHDRPSSSQASRDNYPELMQPKASRQGAHHVLNCQGHDERLGNKYPTSDEIGIAIPYHPAQPQASSMPPQNHNMKPRHTNALSSYPVLPPPNYHFSEDSPFTTPRRRINAPCRTPSPPISPTHRTPRSTRQRSPSRRDASQHRRKSIHKAGPMRDDVPETPRHRSRSRPPRTPKTPKTPGDSFTSVGFVNYTPRDADKLLNDVAPSGSSKTRARREQEARDKRKKLSEAALSAVRRAGGDVKALERVILT